ncbi:MAG TPA: hypothetical protein DC058_17360 [Planctomycetaceae bacterium]|nr:hypothetical protein [Planctomycetaceae bacterium]
MKFGDFSVLWWLDLVFAAGGARGGAVPRMSSWATDAFGGLGCFLGPRMLLGATDVFLGPRIDTDGHGWA